MKEILRTIYHQFKKIVFPNKTFPGWSGNYATWEEALGDCDGYDKPEILEKCKTALLKVKMGEAAYERDSVLFDKIQYSYPLLAMLERAAVENEGSLCVMDFGGSLGSSYFQNKEFLKSLNKITWCIIEQPHYVDCGKNHFENDTLKFFKSIDECMQVYQPNLVLLSGVLQCVAKPFDLLNQLINLKIKYLIIDRTPFIDGPNDMITKQVIPEYIYKASYPCRFMSTVKVKEAIGNNYQEIFCFNSYCDDSFRVGKVLVEWKGAAYILTNK